MSQDEPSVDTSDYRKSLVLAEQAMQREYDKGVMTLSGGALGLSLVFLERIAGPGELAHDSLLLTAWIAWSLSILFILASYFTSARAFRQAIEDTDSEKIFDTLAKNCWATVTHTLNLLGGIGFVSGIVLFVTFVYLNV